MYLAHWSFVHLVEMISSADYMTQETCNSLYFLIPLHLLISIAYIFCFLFLSWKIESLEGACLFLEVRSHWVCIALQGMNLLNSIFIFQIIVKRSQQIDGLVLLYDSSIFYDGPFWLISLFIKDWCAYTCILTTWYLKFWFCGLCNLTVA